jgi:hypothetical protein
MRRILIACALAFSVVAPAYATTRDASWTADVKFLVSELPRRHLNPFTKISRSQFEAAGAALVADIPSLSDSDVLVRMMQLIASVGDGHTTLNNPPLHRLPISLYWFSDGMFVTAATDAEQDLIGLRVVGIGERTIDEATAAVATVISRENDAWLRSRTPAMLIAPEILAGTGVTPDGATTKFVFERANGERFARELAPLTSNTALSWLNRPLPLPLHQRNRHLNYWYEYLPERRAIYIAYNACQNMPSQSFAAFGEELGRVIAEHPVERVILDMRENGGGSSAVLQPLISGIQNFPDLNRPDRFFVFIGRGTFSSAVINSIELDQRTNATFIGEPTGGKPNAYGEVRTFSLPSSGLVVTYSTKFFRLLPGSDPDSFPPNVAVPLTSTDYFTGRDPVLDWVFTPRPRRRSIRK